MTDSVNVFIGYMSCIEEGRYCDEPKAILDVAMQELGPEATQIASLYAEQYGLNLFDELCRPTLLTSGDLDKIRMARMAQILLYTLAGELLKIRFHLGSVSGYSLGYFPAFMLAGLLSVKDVLEVVAPASRGYAADNRKAWEEGRLFSSFLYCPGEPEFFDAVSTVIDLGACDLTVKDARPPYSLQVVGTHTQLVALRDNAFKQFPAAARYSTSIIRSDSAHVDPKRYCDTERIYNGIAFNDSSACLITHIDGPIPAGPAPAFTGSMLFRAQHAGMNMSRVNSALARRTGPVVLIGSKRVSKFAFYGMHDRLFPQPHHFWEDTLLKSAPSTHAWLNQQHASW